MQTYSDMLEKGPRRSVWGTIGAAALGGLTGYANASGKMRTPIPMPNTRGMVYRAPEGMGGGSWDSAISRQRDLAGIESGEAKTAQDRAREAAQEKRWESQDQRDRDYADISRQNATTAAAREGDYADDRSMQRIEQMGGKRPEVKRLAPNEPEPAGWTVVPSPYRRDPPGTRFAVRASPGAEIDEETAQILGVKASGDGKFYAPAPSAINAVVKGEYGAGNQQMKSDDAKAKRDQDAKDRELDRDVKREGIAASRSTREAAQGAKGDKENAALDAHTSAELKSHDKWLEGRHEVWAKEKDPAALEAQDRRTVQGWKQTTQDNYARAVRNRGGMAADFTVNLDGTWTQKGPAYGKGGAASPGGAPPMPGTPPAAAPVASTPPPAPGGRGAPQATVQPGLMTEQQARAKARAAGADEDDYVQRLRAAHRLQ